MLNPQKLRVAVELTSACNLSCAMCPLRTMKRPLEAMPFERLWKVHKELRELGLQVRWLHEMGEPLLYPHLQEALRMFPEAILSTNGMALRGAVAETVLESGVWTVRICIDTLNPEVYPRLRAGGDFVRVVKNTKAFLEAARHKAMKIQIQKMVSKLTRDEARGDFVRFFHLDEYPHARVIEKTCEALDTSGETDLHGKYAGCFQGGPFNWLVILADGPVTHCCYDYEGVQAIGHVDKTPLKEILNSPKLVEIQAAFARHDFSGLPRCCECFRLEGEVKTWPPFLYRWMRVLPFKDKLRKWFL
jgi:MoaA/NifB/PqqE/SkfB family radical SAM enzyme